MDQIILLEDLQLKYPGGRQLFHDFTLSVKKGEKVLILGPSGSGKSTLLQVMSGLIPGVLEVPMLAKETMTPISWGYVFQDPDSQFCMPYVDEELAFVLENLAVQREEMPERICQLLELVGLDLEDMHTSIGKLSGGMKQRLAIASVLAMEPEVLFLDEPTAMLDPEGTHQVWETIKGVDEEKTVIIVEHKVDHILDYVERIVVLDEEGCIVADGPTSRILQNQIPLLKKYGIWYPGVWEEYLEEREQACEIFSKASKQIPIITLDDFTGYRGKEKKIEVEEKIIHSGEWVAIVGENGAGKSTLLESLMQLIKTEGVYMLDGNSVKGIPSDRVGFVFQNPEFQFVTTSVYEEIAYALRLEKRKEEEIESQVEGLLRRFQLEHLKTRHPYQLSMGQKRRLSVASAVIKQPDILLLDEPTFGQDSKNTFRMLEWLSEMKQAGVAIIMVTHDLYIAENFADRIWVVEDGKVKEEFLGKEFCNKAGNRGEQHAIGIT
ncbi:energy-coupling factor ABC transporter ATP-binding protein [Bacillus tianshenii]|uniref:ABC transporter ATP-binding protein n=1 Tax=Sutcliffiella tianshenii TaxID=1463404 RepID=UPI001CD6839D|nr:ABC transporter ATP-binding protein [Bacillus tianshenii]MCA1321245.1 energy-coupling factor ABC transporter ATP-binding protein [Bacillus tianshenii]